jgi:hypothetical protein
VSASRYQPVESLEIRRRWRGRRRGLEVGVLGGVCGVDLIVGFVFVFASVVGVEVEVDEDEDGGKERRI